MGKLLFKAPRTEAQPVLEVVMGFFCQAFLMQRSGGVKNHIGAFGGRDHVGLRLCDDCRGGAQLLLQSISGLSYNRAGPCSEHQKQKCRLGEPEKPAHWKRMSGWHESARKLLLRGPGDVLNDGGEDVEASIFLVEAGRGDIERRMR